MHAPCTPVTRPSAKAGAMSTLVRHSLMSRLAGLRHEPTAKRIRAMRGDRTAMDPTRAVLLWEPRRVVASWAVPAEDMAAALVAGKPATRGADDVGYLLPDVSRRPVLDPSIPFAVHTAEGEVVDIHLGPEVRAGAGLRLADPDLDGYVVLDFDAFDSWCEEDEPNRAPAGSVPPHRCPAKLAPGPARARRRGAGGVGPASAAVRDDASDPLLPAPRGRQGGADPERDPNDLRLQGPRVVLLASGRRSG